jgi:two-component system, sensor histidine kinase and response regulator
MADDEDPHRKVLERLRGMPGIDVDAGLNFVGDSVEIYTRLLNRFVALHEADVEALAEHAASGGDDRLERLCHTIKGGAATLGLPGLAQISQQLEQSLRNGGPREQIAELARALAASHARLKAQLQSASAG